MMMDAAYSLAQEAQGTAAAGDVAFAPMPSVPYGMSARPAAGQPAETIVSGNYYDIAKYYKDVPLALKFIQISTSAAAQLQQFKIMGWMPVTQAGVSEVVTPGTDGFILDDPRDSNKLAKLIELFYGGRSLVQSMGEAAARTAAQFTWEKNARQLGQLFSSVLKTKCQC